MASSTTLTFAGSNYFRQRLVLATVSGRTVKIKKIRAKDEYPGLKEYEASFIRLLDKVTNGSVIEINETGTAIYYQPGMLHGGSFEHDCSLQRGIGYYLEALLCLAPFCKKAIKATLRGITNEQVDPSVDALKLAAIPVLKRFFGGENGPDVKVVKRGAAPEGGGEVSFTCPVQPKLKPIQYTDPGKVKRIRGVAWACRVSPAIANLMVDSARAVLNQFLPDIYIYTDHAKGSQGGKSPGFGLTLVAETTNGTFLCAEATSNKKGSEKPSVPEEIGRDAAFLLLEEVYRGGCVDSTCQNLAALLMVLGEADVSKILMGPISPYTIQMLRHLNDFFGVMFKLEVQKAGDEEAAEESLKEGADKVLLACVGVGFTNLNKVVL